MDMEIVKLSKMLSVNKPKSGPTSPMSPKVGRSAVVISTQTK